MLKKVEKRVDEVLRLEDTEKAEKSKKRNKADKEAKEYVRPALINYCERFQTLAA